MRREVKYGDGVYHWCGSLRSGRRCNMTLAEAWEVEVTREEAVREIKRHGLEPQEFFAEVGDREVYEGGEVLGWIGY